LCSSVATVYDEVRGRGLRQINLSQIKYLAAIVLIGDGVLALVRPHRDAQAWHLGPEAWKGLMRFLSDRPALLRAIGAAEIAGGLALVACRGSLADQASELAAAARARVRNMV
jgi:hypothetical protein